MRKSGKSALCVSTTLMFTTMALSAPGQTAESLHLDFVTHATFFSGETRQPRLVDPHVFVSDSSAPAAAGPQNIQHAASVRPALLDQDPKTVVLLNAKGEALGFDLGQWLGAQGVVTITPAASGKVKISVRFHNLRPGGHYSLFENHFDQKPVGFTPLDGTAKTNDFVADERGNAQLTVTAPQSLTHENAVLLVYHSDKTAHGDQRGDIGINAHHQLIARIPQ
jgi:hypothetical protein